MVTLDPVTKPTLSVDEFAEVTGISRSSAFAAVHNGEVPSIRFGKRIRIPTAAVRRMLELDDVQGGVEVMAPDRIAAFVEGQQRERHAAGLPPMAVDASTLAVIAALVAQPKTESAS